jgi:hypothetical protein
MTKDPRSSAIRARTQRGNLDAAGAYKLEETIKFMRQEAMCDLTLPRSKAFRSEWQ